METETDLCKAVERHAERVRDLLAELNACKLGEGQFWTHYGALIMRAEFLADRATELAALARGGK